MISPTLDWLEGFEAGAPRKKELHDIYEEVVAVYSAIAVKFPSLGS